MRLATSAIAASLILSIGGVANAQLRQASLKGPAAPQPPAMKYLSSGFTPGERVADVAFTDSKGKRGTLALLGGVTGPVIVVRDAECPVSQRYSPRLAELEKEYGAKGYQFVYVDVTPHTRAESVA